MNKRDLPPLLFTLLVLLALFFSNALIEFKAVSAVPIHVNRFTNSISSENNRIATGLFDSEKYYRPLGISQQSEQDHLRSTPETFRVSVDSSGNQGNSYSSTASISADGRFVAFKSNSSNLVPLTNKGYEDVFVHDTLTGQTSAVSVALDGQLGNKNSGGPSISADGRFVAFVSNAKDLVDDHDNINFSYSSIFVRDMQSGVTTRVSVNSDGEKANGGSNNPQISGDGRFVVFTSAATNLDARATLGINQVYIHDRENGETTLVSVNPYNNEANQQSVRPSISADGRFVAFHTAAWHMVIGDNYYSTIHVYVRDQVTGQLSRVSVDSDGNRGNAGSYNSAISADGRFVAFQSNATNLVDGDTNGQTDIFVHDRHSGETSLVSVSSTGIQGNAESLMPSVSANGRFITFQSNATNLVPGDTNLVSDVFLHDTLTGETTWVSASVIHHPSNGLSALPRISANGAFITFESNANNLVLNDTNGQIDVFVRDLKLPTDQLVADFSASETTGVNPFKVGFTNRSSGNFATCLWDFGDGNTSTRCSTATHMYQQAGKYSVSLSIFSTGGSATETKADYIEVINLKADFSGLPTSGAAPLDVLFENTSEGEGISCEWDFGDGNSSDECNPQHTYIDNGTYTVTLSIEDKDQNKDEIIKPDFIEVKSFTADFSAAPLWGQSPLVVRFYDRSSEGEFACLWNFGDGTTSTDCGDRSHTYNNPGFYTVSLSIKDKDGKEDVMVKDDFIEVIAVNANFTATPTNGTVPFTVEFSNTSTGNFTSCLWTFGNMDISNECNPSYTYNTAGVFTVSLLVNGPGGTDVKIRAHYITVNEVDQVGHRIFLPLVIR